MRDDVPGRLDMPVQQRRGGEQADVVRGLDGFDPLGHRRRRPPRQPRAHLVVEDLGGGARHRTEPDIACPAQELRDGQPHPRRTVTHLGRAERVQVHLRGDGMDLFDKPQIAVVGCVDGDRALHADLGGAELPSLVDERRQFRYSIGTTRDDGGVEVAVDHEGQRIRVGDGLARRIGDRTQLIEFGTVRAEQRHPLAVGQRRRVRGRTSQRRTNIRRLGHRIPSPLT